MAKRATPDLLKGTLDALVLKILTLGPQHGWGIAQRIEMISEHDLRVPQGSLYPSLARLEESGWIAGEWGASDNNRRAKFYHLTAAGRAQLQRETKEWDLVSGAIHRVLNHA